MNELSYARASSIEGVFFIHGQNVIEQDWCPLCKRFTKFSNPVIAEMDRIENRELSCDHQITYVFQEEILSGELIKVVRKRIRPKKWREK